MKWSSRQVKKVKCDQYDDYVDFWTWKKLHYGKSAKVVTGSTMTSLKYK
jgi:hypothetical protein